MVKPQLPRLALWSLAAVGVAAIVLLVRSVGLRQVLSQLAMLGPVLPLILLITGCKYPLQAAAWRLALRADQRPPWWRSLGATLAGDAVGYLTLAGPVTGEPARALLLRNHLPIAVGISVGAFERAVYAAAGTLVVLAGFATAAVRLGHSARIVPVLAAILLFALVLFAVLSRRTTTRGPSRPDEPWRAVLRDLWLNRRRSIALIGLLGLLEHATLAGEAAVVLHALGAQPTPGMIVVFEGLTKTVNSIGSVVPGRLGVSEAGTALLAAGLGVGASFGLSLVLVRRARALLWSAAGLGLLLAYGVADRRAREAASRDNGRDGMLARANIPSPSAGADPDVAADD